MDAEMLTRFESALVDDTLTELVREMEAEGRSQVEIFDFFDRFRARLSSGARETEEEAVMDIMDCIFGYCNPRYKLFAHNLTNEEVEAYRRQGRPVAREQEPET